MQYTDMGNRIKLRRKELQIKQASLVEALEISDYLNQNKHFYVFSCPVFAN